MDWNKFKAQWLKNHKEDNWEDHGGHISEQEEYGIEFRIFNDLTVAFGIWNKEDRQKVVKEEFDKYRTQHPESIDKRGDAKAYVCIKPNRKAGAFEEIEKVWNSFCNTNEEFFKKIKSNLQKNNETVSDGKSKSSNKNTRVNQGTVSRAKKSLNELKEINNYNYKILQETFKKKYGREFCGSEEEKLFYNLADRKKILNWNEKVDSVDSVISLSHFEEGCLGNIETADLIILGKNPGADGIETKLDKKKAMGILSEIEDRKEQKKKNIFYPLSSVEAMKRWPWYINRLLWGVGGKRWNPAEREKKGRGGILGSFVKNNDFDYICKHFADKIATVELFPYHTKSFSNNKDTKVLFAEFGLPKEKINAVKNAMAAKKVFITAYATTADLWVKQFPDLKEYDRFFVNHSNGESCGSMHVDKLHLYKNLKGNGDEREKIVDCLKEKWGNQ